MTTPEKKMKGKGWKKVDLPEDLVLKVEELMKRRLERRPGEVPLGLFLSDLIRESLDKAEISEENPPTLEVYAVEPDCVYIRDGARKVVVELKFKDGVDLYCNIDGAKNCVHIGFAWAMPAVQRMMAEKNNSRPKR